MDKLFWFRDIRLVFTLGALQWILGENYTSKLMVYYELSDLGNSPDCVVFSDPSLEVKIDMS